MKFNFHLIIIVFRQDSINSVEFLNQNGLMNPEGTFGEWTFGTSYPIYIEETSILSVEGYIYVIGEIDLK